MSDYSYEHVRRVTYGDTGAQFVPVCPQCGRFVKADWILSVDAEGRVKPDEPNATCSQCGRVAMPFEGYV